MNQTERAKDRRYIVCWDDEMGACMPMQRDDDCQGALCGQYNGSVVLFKSRADARKAIRVSTAFAKLLRAQDKPTNDDFLDGLRHVKIVACESA